MVVPDLSGFDACRELRRAGHQMPVTTLSANHDEIRVVPGLEIGADDSIAKLFRPRELLAHIGPISASRKSCPKRTHHSNPFGSDLS